jgi:hypothetical protein
MIRTVVCSAAPSATNDGKQWKETSFIPCFVRLKRQGTPSCLARNISDWEKGVLPAQASPLCLDPGAASESGISKLYSGDFDLRSESYCFQLWKGLVFRQKHAEFGGSSKSLQVGRKVVQTHRHWRRSGE